MIIHEPQTIETSERARQGITGHGVRYVLMFGLSGVVVAFILLFSVLGA
jgi:hypothetical protein